MYRWVTKASWPSGVVLSGILLLVLAGCGGGSDDTAPTAEPPPAPGAGNGGSNNPPPAVTFTPTPVTTSVYVGGNVMVTTTMTLSQSAAEQTLGIKYSDPGGLVESVTLTQTSALAGNLQIQTSRTLPVGVNSGTLGFYLCKDANCVSQVDGSPFSLPVQVTVLQPPPLQVSQASLSLSVEQLATQLVTLDVTFPAGAGNFSVSDPAGRFASAVSALPVNGQRQTLILSTVPMSSVGSFQGTLTLVVCPVSPCEPDKGYPDGTVTIPYTINVLPLPKVQVTPASFAFSIEQYEPIAVVVDVAVPGTGPLVLRARDSGGLFHTAAEVVSVSGRVYSLRFSAAAIATPGTYAGSLTLASCPSLPCDENLVLSGLGVAVPYTITVTPEIPLAPVPTASGLPEWETFQGNAAHTGYVPVTLDPSAFVQKWTWIAPQNAGQFAALSPVTTGSGKVVVADAGSFRDDVLYAINEASGTVVWQHNFDAGVVVAHPATWGGRVFAATSGIGAALWTFDLASGSQLARSAFSSLTSGYLAPTIKGGIVYSQGTVSGVSGGMHAFKGSTGTQRWVSDLPWFDLWSPAVDDLFAYTHTGGELDVLDRFTGKRVYSVQNNSFSQQGTNFSLNTAPALPGDGSIVVVDALYEVPNVIPNNNLIAYDGNARAESWRVSGKFASNPAVAGGVVYALNALTNRLEARSLTTGQLLWGWSAAAPFENLWLGNLVVTDNLIFLTTNQATHAISLVTHQPVWSYPARGQLALSSNAVLYIAASDRIHAISLK